MPKNTTLTQEKELAEQEQRAVAVSAGGAATQHTWRNIRLIVGREYKNRVTQRSFIISSIVILALVVIAAFVPTVIQYFASNSNSQTKMVVVNNAGPVAGLDGNSLAQSIGATLNGTTNQTTGTNTAGQNSTGKPQFAITISTTNSLNGLQNQVKNGDLNILLALSRSRTRTCNLPITRMPVSQATSISHEYRPWPSNFTSSIQLNASALPRLKRVACLRNRALQL